MLHACLYFLYLPYHSLYSHHTTSETNSRPTVQNPWKCQPLTGSGIALYMMRLARPEKGMNSVRPDAAPDMHAKSRICRSSNLLLQCFPLNPPACNGAQSSVNLSSNCILRIMTNNPMVTIINSANPNHPSIIAVVPTPDLTLPFPKSCAIVLAATDAVCCHSTDTRTNTEAMKIRASATWETGREGKGLTSLSEPRSSVSSCQPGKVARRRKVIKASTMATML